MRRQDKIALITSAGSGIGEATAKTFAREGATVVVVDIDDTNGQRVVEEIQQAGSHRDGKFPSDYSLRFVPLLPVESEHIQLVVAGTTKQAEARAPIHPPVSHDRMRTDRAASGKAPEDFTSSCIESIHLVA